MFERILVPLDGSPRAEEILPHLERILAREDAEILLLRVIDPADAAGLVLADDLRYAEREDAQRYLHGLLRKLGPRVAKIHARVADGWPPDQILETAAAEGATLIAMATAARTGLERWAIGSVADHLARRSDVPLFLVRATARPEAGPRPASARPFRRLLLPIDGSPTSLSVIGAAERFAQLYGSEVLVLHVVPPEMLAGPILPGMDAGLHFLPPTPAPVGDDEITRAAADRFRHAGLEVACLTVVGDPATEIVRVAAARGADLVTMGTHGRSGFRRFALGSVADRVLRAADVPVLLVRNPSEEKVAAPAAEQANA